MSKKEISLSENLQTIESFLCMILSAIQSGEMDSIHLPEVISLYVLDELIEIKEEALKYEEKIREQTSKESFESYDRILGE